MEDAYFAGSNVWILKATGFNRGFGIHCFNTTNQLYRLLYDYYETCPLMQAAETIARCMNQLPKSQEEPESQKPNKVAKESSKKLELKSFSFVVQKYLERPLLIAGRKFDIRVWVLVTQRREVFCFREGYIRTSSSKFSLAPEKIALPQINLTNNAVQSQFKS